MTEQATLDAVRATIAVDVPPDDAFRIFTERLDEWWPRTHHLLDADLDQAVLEPKTGGRWFERAVDGRECVWGRVLAWEPPHRLMLSWDINADFDGVDPSQASEIEVRFTPDGERRTHVELLHRNFERHGDGAEKMRDGVAGDGGWAGGLRAFAELVERG